MNSLKKIRRITGKRRKDITDTDSAQSSNEQQNVVNPVVPPGEDPERVKEELKDVEGIKMQLTKMAKVFKLFLEKLLHDSKTEQRMKDLLIKLGKTNEEEEQFPGFACCLITFADLFNDFVQLQNDCYNESNNIVEKIMDLLQLPINEVKSLKKKYEKAKLEYDQIITKFETVTTSKKIDIIKLYTVEKERVRLERAYNASAEELVTKCEDIKQRINIDFLEGLISFMNAQKTMHTSAYSLLNHLKDYLYQLKQWSDQEETLFIQNQKERSFNRTSSHEKENEQKIKQFITLFEREGFFKVINRLCLEQRRNILPYVVYEFQEYGVPVPPSLTKTASSLNSDLEKICDFIKSNFEVIADKLIEQNCKEDLIALSEALAQVTTSKIVIS